jgi:hypothetical protein
VKITASKFFQSLYLVVEIAWLGILLLLIPNPSLDLTRIFPAAVMFLANLFFVLYIRRVVGTYMIEYGAIRSADAFSQKERINWSDMEEVGIGTDSFLGKQFRWIYFSTSPLFPEQTRRIHNLKQNGDTLKIEFTRANLAAIRKYYKGEIKGLAPEIEHLPELDENEE